MICSQLFGEQGSLAESWLIYDTPTQFAETAGYEGTVGEVCLRGPDPRIAVQLKELACFRELRVVSGIRVEVESAQIPILATVEEVSLTRCSSEFVEQLLTSCPKLERVNLEGCVSLTDNDLRPLENLKQLTELRVYDASVSGAFINFLRGSRLRKLILLECHLDEGTIDLLAKLNTLESLTITINCSEDSINNLRALPLLRKLEISPSQLEKRSD